MTWTYLSKKGADEYIDLFACGSGAIPTTLETWNYDSNNDPLVIRGIMKHKIIKQCWEDKRRFRYMDSGYVGNRKNPLNPNGWKQWHRIVDNDLQHNVIVTRPSDRWDRLKIQLRDWRKDGRKILVAVPDEKPCIFYGIELDKWIDTTINEIKKYTDRPIELRVRDPNRQNRVVSDLESALDDNVFALVTFNSIAATESIIAGIPAFVLAPCNAALPVSNVRLSDINSPWYPDQDLVHAWACHLAYGQFHNDELRDGTAARILFEHD
jgi:hypothetical protein